MNLFDTDVVIDSIQKRKATPGAISVITLLEVLRGVDEGRRSRVKELLERNYAVRGIDNDVILLTCRLYNQLRRDGEPINEADLIIAATAMALAVAERLGITVALCAEPEAAAAARRYGLQVMPGEAIAP